MSYQCQRPIKKAIFNYLPIPLKAKKKVKKLISKKEEEKKNGRIYHCATRLVRRQSIYDLCFVYHNVPFINCLVFGVMIIPNKTPQLF